MTEPTETLDLFAPKPAPPDPCGLAVLGMLNKVAAAWAEKRGEVGVRDWLQGHAGAWGDYSLIELQAACRRLTNEWTASDYGPPMPGDVLAKVKVIRREMERDKPSDPMERPPPTTPEEFDAWQDAYYRDVTGDFLETRRLILAHREDARRDLERSARMGVRGDATE